MKNFKEESRTQNKHDGLEHINSASDPQTSIPDPTLQRKVSSKIEITITREQLAAAKWLFKQADKPKPNWLRKKFLIDQRRRKCLNVELMEAQLDRVFCNRYRNTDEWYDLLHLLWHDINGGSSCI